MAHLSRIPALALTFAALLWGVPAYAQGEGWSVQAFGSPPFRSHQIDSYEIGLEATNGVADVYFPDVNGSAARNYWRHERPFPVVVYLQGAQLKKEMLSMFALGVAQHGFVVVVPNNVSRVLGEGFSDVHLITSSLEEMREEELDPDSPLFGIVDPSRLGLSGHSFGGVAASNAIGGVCFPTWCDTSIGFQRPPELLAAAIISSATGSASPNSGIPVAVILGSNDQRRADYEVGFNSLQPPKAFIVVEGANHYSVLDTEPEASRERRGEPPQIYRQSISATLYARWAGLFFRTHILKDWRAGAIVYRSAGEEGVDVQSTWR